MLAALYNQEGNFPEAEKYLLAALEKDKAAENSPGIGKDLFAIGSVYQRQGQNEDALIYYSRALSVFNAFGNTEETEKTLFRLIDTANALGRKEEAARYRILLESLRSGK